jgi:hypothetical protein
VAASADFLSALIVGRITFRLPLKKFHHKAASPDGPKLPVNSNDSK